MRLRVLEFTEKLRDLHCCGAIEWCLAENILGIHVRLDFDNEKLHDLQLRIRCGDVEWCLPETISLGIHVRLEFDHEKLHNLQMPIRCGEVEWCPAVIILGISSVDISVFLSQD